jgi:hypothetical protein
LPTIDESTAPAWGPDTRTIAIALGGRPDERAKIVCSRGCIAYLVPNPLKAQGFARLQATTPTGAAGLTFSPPGLGASDRPMGRTDSVGRK